MMRGEFGVISFPFLLRMNRDFRGHNGRISEVGDNGRWGQIKQYTGPYKDVFSTNDV